MKKNNRRRAVRLQIANGVAILHAPDCPSLACELLDLSETGCRCRATLQNAGADIAAGWSWLLAPGGTLETAISRPPQLRNFTLSARVTHAERQKSGEIQIGLHFNAKPEQLVELRNALLSLASGKIGASYPVTTPEMNRRWDEGADNATTGNALLNASDLRDALSNGQPDAVQSEMLLDDAKRGMEAKIGKLLLSNPEITAADLCHALAIQSKLPIIKLDIEEIPSSVRNVFSYLTQLRFRFVPFAESREMVCIAAADPLASPIVNELENLSGRHVLVFLAPADQIHALQYKSRPRTKSQERRFTRIKASVAVSYQFADGLNGLMDRAARAGTTLNISEAGALVMGPAENSVSLTDINKDINKNRKLIVCLDPAGKALRVIARMLYVKQAPNLENRWLFGLEWATAGGPDSGKLADFFKDIAVDQLKKRSLGFAPTFDVQ